jgi:hypothetical protein
MKTMVGITGTFTLGKKIIKLYGRWCKSCRTVLTGWRIRYYYFFFYDNSKHDKTISSSLHFSNHVVIGKTLQPAMKKWLIDQYDLDKKLEVSVTSNQKIYRWFCYYTVDANTETNVIEPLIQLFRDSNWEIKRFINFVEEWTFLRFNVAWMFDQKSGWRYCWRNAIEFNVVFLTQQQIIFLPMGWNFRFNRLQPWTRMLAIRPVFPAGFLLPGATVLWIVINSDTLPKEILLPTYDSERLYIQRKPSR